MSSLDNVILVIQISTAFLITAEGACNSSALPICRQDNELPRSELLTEETLQKACKSYEAFMNCTEFTGCLDDPEIRAEIRGVQDTFDEICQKLKDEYLSHGSCLESNEVKRAENLCTEPEHNDDNQQYTECEAKNRFLNCVVSHASVHCGSEAGNLYGYLLKKLFQPTMTRLFQCQLRLDTDLEVETPVLCESTAMPAAMTTAMSTAASTATSTAASTATTEMTHSTNGSNCLRSSLSIIYYLMFIMLLLKPPAVFKLGLVIAFLTNRNY